ncbi:GNAT family N-acetyltransferase [Desulfuromonas sp. KJ2020]|uniref:GNAT family N-acetyltransferase n=1 Tax=Desulfuromonas sp. KJ2020 TaxID=2919173 RepID=UPI0020A72DD3|nr:GNAT family N-acetyltransferase [Desulfuromonas sp. KJ2020]MCP3178142.1 GNAT family N-acetyltransferase [Desulfuromonas sp. KJ2020]
MKKFDLSKPAMKIRDFEQRDIEDCIRLLQVGHTPDFTRRRFEWLHFQNPMAPSRIVVAEHEGRIVGLYSAIKKHVRIDGKRFIGARDVDPVVHPDFRNKGIFKSMLDHALKHYTEIDFHFNFANTVSKAGFLSQGWQEVGSINDCLHQVNYDHLLSKKFLLFMLSNLKPVDTCRIAWPLEALNCQQFSSFVTNDHAGVIVERTYEYLTWRYTHNPLNTYSNIADGPGPELQKFAIGKFDQLNGGFILHDFFVSKNSLDHSVDYVVNFVKDNNFSTLRTWRTCLPVLRSQMVCNPYNRHSTLRLLVRKRSQHVSDAIYDLNKWILTPGDLEIM